ncbi:WG repeat protein [Flavobacterium sp. 90]|uniref:WG repeat-containing protein n=1 Tax=unclassified Flavobacterium TaxID=196869 RepID=UPI000EADA223|nr:MULTISPECIES: WG repeat-containing protein [unclassified Flavobacterium]RKR11946.1 WG repeat protein [Flavobacterium sp. 81]TCK55720.1 WG repeat protein [Flavobacterium sp. 90]
MKKIFLLLLILNQFSVFSQTDKLYYFIEKDSLLGVKNQNGKIIIPAAYTLIPSIYDGILKEEIKGNLIPFWVIKDGLKMYDRKGNFLFEPYMFDAGFDDFSEGYMRFVENKKLGFANRNGVKVIPAQYDWVSHMNFGFTEYCNGCYFDYSKDEEHPSIVGGTWGYIDKNGVEIKPTEKRNHPKDFETEKHQFIPYQFVYNKKEKQILDFFEKRKTQIIKIYKINCLKKELYFEIIEKPSDLNPFYKIKTFEICDQYFQGANENYDECKIFKVSADGKNFFVTYMDLVDHEKYSEYVERKIPVDEWIKKN